MLFNVSLFGIQVLLRAHAVDHGQHVNSCHVNLLLFCCKWSLCWLESLLLVLLFLGSFFWIFSYSSIIGVSEENTLFLWRLISNLSLFIFFDKDGVNSFINSLGGSFFEVLFIARFIKIQNIFKEFAINGFAFLFLCFLNGNVVPSVLDIWNGPVIGILIPFSSMLYTHVFIWWNKLINQQMLHSDFSCQFPDSIHQVFSFSMNNILHIIELSFNLSEFRLNLFDFVSFYFKFFLLWGEFFLEFHLFISHFFVFLFNSDLFSSLFLKGSFGFEEFLLLFHGFIHGFVSNE